MIWRKVSAVTCALALSALALVGGTLATQSARAATSMCTVSYSLTNSWPGGFQAGISITNNGPALTSWALAFTFPNDQTVSNGWSATFTQNGQDVTAASESYNGALATGASVSIGFVGAVGPVDSSPTYFTVNGYACNGATQVPSVELTSPSANSGYAPGASIAIDATASEPTASITKVEILEKSALPSGAPANPTVLATETASPYNFTWADVGAGDYILTAEAFDSSGNSATSAPITISVVPTTSTAPKLQVSGDKLVTTGGTSVVLHGVDRSGTEYECVHGYGIFDGPNTQASITAMKGRGVNAVRVPLNEACWNAESYVNSAYAGANYQSAIEAYVNLLNENGIVAILDLHWTDGAYSGPSSGWARPRPSARSRCRTRRRRSRSGPRSRAPSRATTR